MLAGDAEEDEATEHSMILDETGGSICWKMQAGKLRRGASHNSRNSTHSWALFCSSFCSRSCSRLCRSSFSLSVRPRTLSLNLCITVHRGSKTDIRMACREDFKDVCKRLRMLQEAAGGQDRTMLSIWMDATKAELMRRQEWMK